jgi:hypothetical protein
VAAVLAAAASLVPLARATHPVVVFDEAHGQRFHIQGKTPLDLSGLASLVTARRGATELWTKPLLPGTLDGVSALVVSGPFSPITEEEVRTIVSFAFGLNPEGTGTVALATTSPKAFVDRDRNGRFSPADIVASVAVVVAGTRGKGELVAFGDDALFQNQFLVGSNRKLGENLAGWLAAAR